MPKETIKQRSLSIFLIKNNIKRHNLILNNLNTFKKKDIILDDHRIGILYFKQTEPKPPNWADLFDRCFDDLSDLGVKTSGAAGILIVEKNNNIFAVTFGYGGKLLAEGCWVERFGLKVTLNSIVEGNIRSIVKKTFDAIPMAIREQSSKEGSTIDFELDVDKDLVKSITGTPKDEYFGKQITGFDTLNVKLKIKLEDIPNKLDEYYRKSLKNTYKENFAWIDHIKEITNKELINKLNTKLINQIRSKSFEKLWLNIPEIIDWTEIDCFKYSTFSKAEELHDIHFNTFIEYYTKRNNLEDIDIDKLKNRSVYAFDTTSSTFKDKWSIYKCIYFEISEKDKIYLLSEGNWYNIEDDFVKRINNEYDKIAISEENFPDYKDKSEEEYNKRVCELNKNIYYLMDKKNINFGGGRSKFEFCDIYSIRKKIIHIKRYTGSSTLSHLFNQGLNSAELFILEEKFRKEVNKLLPLKFKIKDLIEKPKDKEYEIIYGIISKSQKKLVLPFFSKMSLCHANKRLVGYGFKVSLQKIRIT